MELSAEMEPPEGRVAPEEMGAAVQAVIGALTIHPMVAPAAAVEMEATEVTAVEAKVAPPLASCTTTTLR